MAFSYGKKFRRLATQALSADQGEMRALIERILPAGGSGKRELCLETYADCRLAPVAVLAAFFTDAISGAEAVELMRQAEHPEAEQGGAPRRFDPLEKAFEAWAEPVPRRDDRSAGCSGQSLCNAAREATQLVNINENTSAAGDSDASR